MTATDQYNAIQIFSESATQQVVAEILDNPLFEEMLDAVAARAIKRHVEQEQTWLSTEETAEYLRMSVSALGQARRKGAISGTRRGKSYIYSRATIERFLGVRTN